MEAGEEAAAEVARRARGRREKCMLGNGWG